MKKILLTTISIIAVLVLLASCDFGKETVDITTPTSTTEEQSQSSTTSVPTTTTTTTISTNTTTTTTTTTESTPIKSTESNNSDLPKYIPGSIKIQPVEFVQADLMSIFIPTKRYVYYSISGFFMDLVDSTAYDEWAYKNLYIYVEEGPQEMVLVSFVKHFNISRKDFDKVVEQDRLANKKLGIDDTEELYELPNADIIYTFDNDIINEYYRRQ